MKFAIATRHFAGLGFAMRLQEEGHDVLMAYTGIDDRRVQPRYDLVGKGIVPKRPLADVIADRESFRDWYFVWDEDHSPDEAAHNLYFYDVYRDHAGDLLMAGYYDNVLIATAFGYTIETAWEAAYETARSVKFPDRSFRTDGAGTDYPSSPLRRYQALQAMGSI